MRVEGSVRVRGALRCCLLLSAAVCGVAGVRADNLHSPWNTASVWVLLEDDEDGP